MSAAATASPQRPLLRTLILAVLPSRWLVLGVAVAWVWRLAGWVARQAFTLLEVQPREMTKGLLWDLALVYALFAIGRAAALHRGSPLGAARALSRAASGAVAVIAIAAVAIRALDTGHCLLGQSHWTAQAFMYLDRGFSGTLLQVRTMAALLGTAASAALLVWALYRDRRGVARRLVPRWRGLGANHRRLVAWSALLLAIGPAAWALRDGIQFPAHVHDWRLVPEINFAGRWLESRGATAEQRNRIDLALPAETWAAFVTAGLVPPDSQPDDPFPLLRPGLGEPPLPLPRRADVPADLRPNVVVTFMESVNELFVHELSGRHAGLMPEVAALANKMSRVEGFHNTASPTIVAMVAALCSVHPASHPYDLAVGESVDGRTAYTCLADVLRRQGYRTVYIQGASRKVTSKEYFFRTHGFDEVYGLEDIRKLWPKRERGVWGFFDRDTFAFAADQVRRLEALQAQDGRPFLVVNLTLDPHEPGMGPPEALANLLARQRAGELPDLPADNAARQLLASYHSSDAALGTWGRFLLEPKRAARTLWLLTSDHAAFRNLVSDSIFLGLPGHRSFDKVPFLLHDPLHELPKRIPTLAGTTDVTPTLLHLLGHERGLNCFTGMSIFGRRRDVPVLVGRVGARYAYVHNGSAAADLAIGVVRERCRQGRPLIAGGGDPLPACALVAWLDWSDKLWAARRLFPVSAYFGDAGIDKRELALKMYQNKAEERATRRQGHKQTDAMRRQALEKLIP